MKKHDISFDIIRIVACLMVVAMHAPLSGIGTPGHILSGLGYIEAPCIGLFFMISGALLLPSGDMVEEFNTWSFLKKRLMKVLIPLISWYSIGVFLNSVGLVNSEVIVLWFLFVLVGLYLLTPVLARWLAKASKRELELYMGIWFFSLCIPYIQLLFDFDVSDKSWIYYFHGYVGYFVLGHYLNRYENEICLGWRKWCYCFAFGAFTLAAPLIVLFLDLTVDFYSLFWYLSIGIALSCIAWWYAIRSACKHLELGEGTKKRIKAFSKLTFGIYLVHALLLPLVVWPLFSVYFINLEGIFQIFLTTLITLFLSSTITWTLSKIKGLKMIVGY